MLAGIENPVDLIVPANQQTARLVTDLFGGSLDPSTVGWFQATSSVSDLTGFFLFLNGLGTVLDGADLPDSAKKIVFNRIKVAEGFSTELNIINPSGRLPSNCSCWTQVIL